MNDTQRGNRVGPYQLGPRFKGTGDTGRIYRAHHVETGAPALVLQRTERQSDEQPLADWRVLVTSSVSPAFLALEVVRAPAAGLPADVAEEFVVMLGDAEQLANAVVDRTETLPHLRRPPLARQLVTPSPAPRPAPLPSRSWQRPSLAAGFAALAAAAVLHLGGARSGLELRHDAGAEFAHADMDAGWGGSAESADDLVLTGMDEDAPFLLARALPKKPFSNQKRPPCDADLEAEIFNGCWVATDKTAPCPDKLYEFKGKCYLPAAKQESAPTAFSRQPLAFDRQ
ncbi:MAG TPA: hypothetical protein VEZ71_01145 [Archangium sp.]|nr:hypothetical protein [Archangium sp.]